MAKMTKIVNSMVENPDSSPFLEPVDWRALELWDYPSIVKKMMDLGTIQRKLERGQYSYAAEVAKDVRLVWDNCMMYNAGRWRFCLISCMSSCHSHLDLQQRGATSGSWPNLSARSLKTATGESDRTVRVLPLSIFLSSCSHCRSVDVGEEEILESETEEEGEEEDDDDLEGEAELDDEEEEVEAMDVEEGPKKRSARTANMMPLDDRAELAADLLLLNGLELGQLVAVVEECCPKALSLDHSVPEHIGINVDRLDSDTLEQITKLANEAAASRRKPSRIKIQDVSGKRRRKK